MTTGSPDTVAIASSLDLAPDRTFVRRAQVLRTDEPATVANQLRVALRLLRAARGGRALILYSAWGRFKPDLLVAGLFGLLPAHRRPPVVLVGEVLSPTPGWRQRVERLVMRLADRGIDRYVTTGVSEVPLLAETWGVAPAKIGHSHVPFSPEQYGLAEGRWPRGRHVFAGGDSLRDWPALLEVARQRPDLRFVVATTLLDPADVPANVEVHPVRIGGYPPLLRDAGVVVVPIVRGVRRGAGGLTLLMAMWLRRPVVATDTEFTREYVQPEITGLLVEGDPASYRAAIERLLDPAQTWRTERIADAGHDLVADRCGFGDYVATILDELDRVVRRRRPRSPAPVGGPT